MTVDVDEARLDDAAAIAATDPQGMLRAVATSAAQVRMGLTAAYDAGFADVAAQGRPRAIVVAGMGGSGIAGDVFASVAGLTCPVPIVVHRGPGLPGWAGAADLVVAVSCSGTTDETLSAADEAVRRGATLLGIAAAGSPLARRCEQARGAFAPVVTQVGPRATLWGLATPLLVLGARLGLLDLGRNDEALEAAAQRLEAVAETCRPDREAFVNPAKVLAVELAGSLPMVWGTGQIGGVAALRMVCQFAENAKYPAVPGVLSEAHHNQVVTFDGAFGAGSAGVGRGGGGSDDDFFRDRVDDEAAETRLRLVLLRDDDNEASTLRARISEDVAGSRSIPTTVIRAEGTSPVERLASLVCLTDFATVYLAILQGIDPSPVPPIDEVKRRLENAD
ncbi:MAG: glucose/mannose-6-phosphate isomerase [Frankiaceae bacterium]|nr:glucose/mannose-6-phosphate isomerase [Frankiaceae bacterium]